MIEELQKEYDSKLAKIKALDSEMNKFIDEIKSKGFTILDEKIQEDKKVYGAFYDISYYSHFDGHTSDPIYKDYSGAEKLSDMAFNGLKNMVEEVKAGADKDKAFNALCDFGFDIVEDFWEAYNFWDHFEIKDDGSIEWTYSGDGEQGEVCSDSGVIFRISTESEIKKTKTKEKTTRG